MRSATRALLALAFAVVALPMLVTEPVAAAGPAPLRAGAARPGPDVVGYLPAWELASTPATSLRYDLLTTIVLFDVPIRRDGSLDRSAFVSRGVMGARAGEIIRRAHASGVRVLVSFTSFGAAANAAFLGSRTARARFVRDAVALVSARGADGIDLDIESIRAADVRAYGQLVRAVTAAERRANRAARVSVATDANAIGARMAATAVANGADRVFVMSYAMRTGSAATAGSIAPLDRRASSYSIHAALDLYLARGVPANRTVLGLPLYGLMWRTTGPGLNARTRGTGRVVLASSVASVIGRGAASSRDGREVTARWTWYDRADRTWRQVYLDDAVSTAAKARYGLGRHLAGFGLWALGYERGQPAYWTAIAGVLGRDTQPPVVTRLDVRWDPSHRRWRVTWSGRDAGTGIARYVVVYRVGSRSYRPLVTGTMTSATIVVPRSARVRVAIKVFDRAGNVTGWRYTTGRR